MASSRSPSAPASPRPAGRSLAAAAVKVQDKVRRQGRTRQITINLKNAKNAAAIVREVAVGEMKWKEASTLEESCNANLYWYERAISVEEVKRLSDWQRVNMIPGMQEMAKKASLARALNRMRALFPDEYDFFPGTWTLPAQLDEFRKHCAAQSSRARPSTFIVKPSGGCQGAGIYLIRGVEGLLPHSAAVVQEYLATPMLCDGLKFDLRLYVVVRSLQPLQVSLYREGMARFATSSCTSPTPRSTSSTRSTCLTSPPRPPPPR